MENKKIIAIVSTLFLLASCGQEGIKPVNNTISVDTYAVQKGSIAMGETYTGLLEGDESTIVAPKTPGRIVSLTKEKGDFVKKGELLATLDGEEASVNLSAVNGVLASTRNLYTNTEKSFDAQIKSVEEKIKQAEQGVKIAQENLSGITTGVSDTESVKSETLKTIERQIEQAEIGVKAAQTRLDNTFSLYDEQLKNIYSNANNGLSGAKILAVNFVNFTDEILGVTEKNKTKNDAYESDLGAIEKDSKLKVLREFEILLPKVNSWVSKVESLDFKPGDEKKENKQEEIYNLLKESIALYEELRVFSSDFYELLDNTPSSSALNTATLTSYKNQVVNFQGQIETTLINIVGDKITGLKGSVQGIDSLNKQINLDIDLLKKDLEAKKKGLELAKQSYNSTNAQTSGQLNEVETKKKVAENQLELSKLSYSEAKASLESLKAQKDSQLSQIRAQINNLSGQRGTATLALKNSKVVAPFDGVIVNKMASVGQVLGAGTPVYMISKDEKLKLKVFVPEDKISSVNLTDKVNIFVKAINKNIEGEITRILPTVDNLSKRIGIEIKVDNTDKKLKIGNYSVVSLDKNEISGLVVPYEFVKYQFGQSYLVKINEEDKKRVKIEINIEKCNAYFCAISSEKIKENDEIIDY
ncbi:MAG: efflux RND transporter periplasmic adaptor subunit [Candidatus Gracilibacteria bacterium]|nr:efflux RND transporter periplasmic adaptor subunit [Candidatus Gracilibacteria bacterium]